MRNFFFLFLIFFAFNLSAQNTFHAGLLAGINGCQIHGDSYSGFDQAGIVGGAFVSTDPEKKVYFQMELQYSRKGSKRNTNPDKNDFDYFELRMDYIEVPLLCRVNYRKLYFEFGQTFGVLSRVREWDDFGEIQPSGFRRWETALVLGIGYNISERWYVDFRYTNSVAPVKKFNVPLYYPNRFSNLFNKGMYNNVLGLTACYRFGKKAKE
ncbi:MAG: PorT family protein [Bacteroidota bacterium]|nr:PorT family protein [Bacteroidota bacterium]